MIMRSPYTTTITKMASLFTLLEKKGFDVAKVLEFAEIDPRIVETPDNRLSTEQVSNLTQKAMEVTGDEFLGLHQGEEFVGLSNILGHIMMNCQDIEEAMEKYQKYQKIADEIIITKVEEDISHMKISYQMADSRYAKDVQMMDYRLSGCHTFYKKLTGVEIPLQEVRFQHPAPIDDEEYRRVFDCPVLFSQDMNTLVYNKGIWKTKVIQPNPQLLEVFEEHAENVHQKYISGESYTKKIARYLINSLNGNSVGIDVVAGKFGMSVRKLQNKLKDEDTSFSNLYDSIKKNMALEYLKERDTSISEIAYLLGFSEPSAFHRSFKRWTGLAPGVYRDQFSNNQEFEKSYAF